MHLLVACDHGSAAIASLSSWICEELPPSLFTLVSLPCKPLFIRKLLICLPHPHYHDDGEARGYVDIPQVGREAAVHLYPQNAATWINLPHLPSKACKLKVALVAKGCSDVGQATSALHAMAILQVHQAKVLKCTREVPTQGLCRSFARLLTLAFIYTI